LLPRKPMKTPAPYYAAMAAGIRVALKAFQNVVSL
jgi:hypothetical protein